MTAPLQWFLRACATLCTLLACSCLDVREEFWIHKDRSATAEVTCQMPRAATLATGGSEGIRKLVERILAKESCVDSYEVKVTELQDRTTLKIRCSVDDVMSFQKLRDSIKKHDELPPPVRKMVGEFEIGIDGFSGISVRRTVSAGEAVPALLWLPKSQLEGHRLVKIIHFPHPVSNHNAHDSWDNNCTLAWESSLASALQNPVVYRFVMPVPLPWVWIITGTFGLVAALAIIVLLVRKKRSRRNSAASSTG